MNHEIAPLILSMDFDNMKVIERWAEQFMTLVAAPYRCRLFIPYKEMDDLDGTQALDNYNAVERWAAKLTRVSKCQLLIPYKTVLRDYERGVITLAEAQTREFENYKIIERWGNRYSTGECECLC